MPCCLQVQSASLNKLLFSQAYCARRACILGGGWDPQDLQRAADSLASLDQHLELHRIDSAQEAACLSAALPSCPVKIVIYQGSAPCTLPSGTGWLLLDDTFQPDNACPFPQNILPRAQHALAACRTWQHLAHLQILTLTVPTVVSSLQGELQQLTAYPRLRRLKLAMPASLLDARAASVLRSLVSVEIRLEVPCATPTDIVPFLEPQDATAVLGTLRGVSLHTLELRLDEGLDSNNETLLARCSISTKLVLRVAEQDWRLERQLPGVTVHYLPYH